MGTMNTEIHVLARDLPVEYVRYINAQYPDDAPLGPDDECPDVPVTVEYREGWYQAGNRRGHPDNWTPDEGEDPEIESVHINDDDYEGPTELWLPNNILDNLTRDCWEDQTKHGLDYEPDYDDYEPDHYDNYEPMGSNW